jgi:hypothetical protein
MEFSIWLNWITDAALVFSFLLSPLFFFWAARNEKKIPHSVYSWKIPGAAVLTIAAFAINLGLFISMAIFFSGILGSRTYPELFTFSGDTMRRLALVSGSLMFGVTLVYLGMMRTLTQIVTSEGIWLIERKGLDILPRRTLLPWTSIQDYYFREDYPVRLYSFISLDKNNCRKQVVLKVPFPACSEFEHILEHFLNMELNEDSDYFSLPDFRSGKKN